MTTNIALRLGEARAVISLIGAGLRGYHVGGRAVTVSTGAVDGAVLAPWPNRIADGRYEFDGRTFQLPITEPARHTAIHGLVAHIAWSLRESTDTSAVLETMISPTEGYPFSLALTVTYELDEVGLRIHARARNTGAESAPFGFGFHPWLSPGAADDGAANDSTADDDADVQAGTGRTSAAVDGAQLLIPARTWYETDDRLIPTAVHPFDDGSVVPRDHDVAAGACILCKDFRALRSIGETVLDDPYGAPVRGADGWSRARLRGLDGRETTIAMGPAFRVWQACTGDELDAGAARRSIAIEPMTCPPNAFATGEDFDVIEPEGELSAEWSISLGPKPGSPTGDAAEGPENSTA